MSVGSNKIQYRNAVERNAPGIPDALLVVERRTEGADALAHRVFPVLVFVGIERFVNRRIHSFLDAGTVVGSKRKFHILGKIPGQAEIGVPEKVFAEIQGNAVEQAQRG